jgi:chromosome segregation ATPase
MVHITPDSEGVTPEMWDEEGAHRRQGGAITQIREWYSPLKVAKEALAEKSSQAASIADRLRDDGTLAFELKNCRVALGAYRSGIEAGDYAEADVAADITKLQSEHAALMLEQTDLPVERAALDAEIPDLEATRDEQQAVADQKTVNTSKIANGERRADIAKLLAAARADEADTMAEEAALEDEGKKLAAENRRLKADDSGTLEGWIAG